MILNISTNSVYCNHTHDLSFPQFYPPPLQAQPSLLHTVSLTLPSSLSGSVYITGSFKGREGVGVGVGGVGNSQQIMWHKVYQQYVLAQKVLFSCCMVKRFNSLTGE